MQGKGRGRQVENTSKPRQRDPRRKGGRRTDVGGVDKLGGAQRLEADEARGAVHLGQRQLEARLVGGGAAATTAVGPVPEQGAEVDPDAAGAQHVVDDL